MKKISEINFTPVKPNKGLIGFCSFVLFESIYCASVAVFSRPKGGYRLVYPTRKAFGEDIHIFHPINSTIGHFIEEEVANLINNLMKHD